MYVRSWETSSWCPTNCRPRLLCYQLHPCKRHTSWLTRVSSACIWGMSNIFLWWGKVGGGLDEVGVGLTVPGLGWADRRSRIFRFGLDFCVETRPSFVPLSGDASEQRNERMRANPLSCSHYLWLGATSRGVEWWGWGWRPARRRVSISLVLYCSLSCVCTGWCNMERVEVVSKEEPGKRFVNPHLVSTALSRSEWHCAYLGGGRPIVNHPCDFLNRDLKMLLLLGLRVLQYLRGLCRLKCCVSTEK